MGPMGFGPEGTSGLVSALAVTNAIAATLTATNPGALLVSFVFITILLLASSSFLDQPNPCAYAKRSLHCWHPTRPVAGLNCRSPCTASR